MTELSSSLMRTVPETSYFYKVLPLDPSNLTAERLNALGSEGWLLVATLLQLVLVRSTQRTLGGSINLSLLLTIKQASEKLGVSRSKMYAFINSGQLKCVRPGKRARIPRQELEILILERLDS
jgi:excisionase family DNA binding protein